MKVKLEQPTVWEGEPRAKGSVIEVPEDVWEKNQGWMKPTDSPVTEVKKPKADGDKPGQ